MKKEVLVELKNKQLVMTVTTSNWGEVPTIETKEIKVGMGVTLKGYSDRRSYTIIAIKGKSVTLQRDKVTLSPDFKPDFVPGGFVGHVTNNYSQAYIYESDPEGAKTVITLRKDGCFYLKGSPMWRPGTRVATTVYLDKRSEFYDYNF